MNRSHKESFTFKSVALVLLAALLLLVLAGCEKKEKMPLQDTIWRNRVDLSGMELQNTMTCRTDGTFSVETSALVLGLPLSITAVEGTFTGDISSDGEALFTIEKLAKEFSIFIPAENLAQTPVVRTVQVKDGAFSIDIGIGQDLVFTCDTP